MGIPDRSLLIEKVWSWLSWGSSDLSCLSCELNMAYNSPKPFCNCKINHEPSCKFCSDFSNRHKRYSDKIHPTESPRQSPEPPSPSYSSERVDGCLLHDVTTNSHPSPVSVHRSPSRSDEDEGEDSAKHFFSPYSHDTSDVDSSSVSSRHEFYSFRSVGSSPWDSPSRIHITSNRGGPSVQQEPGETPRSLIDGPSDPENTFDCTDDSSIFRDPREKFHKPLDFENNGPIWFPPPPDDLDDEDENNFFAYDDDDDEIGESSARFTCSDSLASVFPNKEKQCENHKEPLRTVVQGHFRVLVSQLLQGECIEVGNEDSVEDWLDIITKIAWQAANFVKPDTSRGGSMDPGDYVKVKCIASGRPSESKVIKGVVCTKNIKHKRMTSQYKNARLLILGGALEYQRVANQLASFDTLLQQEIEHLKMIVSRIEAQRPNVLLVEKSVSSYAQEYLLAKDISLVLNVKRSLLERIARCTGASITPSIDNISTAQLGNCELFRLERVGEEHELGKQVMNKKPSKTLMFFEGCPRRLGCTILLKGSHHEELKKIKHVVQYAVFAAYHLSLETSFLADEGASLPKMTIKSSIATPEKTADNAISAIPTSVDPSTYPKDGDLLNSLPTLTDVFYDAFDDDSATAVVPLEITNYNPEESLETRGDEESQSGELHELTKFERIDEATSEYYSATDSNQSILVSFSSRCVLNGTVCERSRLLRIKFYGCFDKPLGRYLRDDLFDQTSSCRSCKEPAEAHVICYTHQQGNLTINVKRLPSMKLPGERDGKIWMWHRCLRCAHIDGVPPATRRVVMSDAAWGLSLGKFLELSFSNHATANRVANCGHSLQKDCLRYYGCGSMVAFFRYSPIDILSVRLPPSMLEFNGNVQQDWLRKEVSELLSKKEALYDEISGALDSIEQTSTYFGHEISGRSELWDHMELRDMLENERNDFSTLLQPPGEETSESSQAAVDILELNNVRHSLLIASHVWDRRLYSLDSLLKTKTSSSKDISLEAKHQFPKEDTQPEQQEERNRLPLDPCITKHSILISHKHNKDEEPHSDEDVAVEETSSKHPPAIASNLSEKIDSAWAGTNRQTNRNYLPSFRSLMSPTRVYSFDSALRFQDRARKGLPPSSLHLSTLKSFHASGDYRNMVRDPVSNVQRTYPQMSLRGAQNFISSASLLPEEARLLPQQNNIVIAVHDNEPSSIISYALSSKVYEDWVADKPKGHGGAWESFGSVDLDYAHYGSYGPEDASARIGALFTDPKSSHLKISFEDESSSGGGKVKFAVTCYLAKQFDALWKKCCPSKMDFVRSLSRCKRWSAQGGKSNVFFAKSLDERFIIKQVTKTELESFEEFAPEYFKYLTDSLDSGSPTCLAKVLGIYQVTVKHLKGGKETKMDLMVMENLFFKRNISRVYDLKGSLRSRYNSDTTGTDKVLLDMNLLEALRTKPIFLGSKAKRSLERAVWNDTSFLASVDVMDYSLLVGVDDDRKELVLGIIDFMRQYTWDKHLETWVKASGILGGPKNASPTIISPKQYKRRFRKAMTTYFLTVPDQWSS